MRWLLSACRYYRSLVPGVHYIRQVHTVGHVIGLPSI